MAPNETRPAHAGGASPSPRTKALARSVLGDPAHWPVDLKPVLGLLLEAEAEIVLFWGPDHLAFYNDAYAPTIGAKHPQAFGRPARENWAELWDDLGPLLDGVRTTGQTVSAKDRPFLINRRGEMEEVFFDISYSPVPGPEGEPLGVLCIVSETTGRRLAEKRLRENEANLQAVTNSIDHMVWATRPDGYHDYYNDRWYAFTGMTPGATDGDDWNGMFHPDDRERAWATWRRSLRTGEPYQIEYRLRHRSGAYRWVLGRAQAVRDASGAITRWFGTCTDIHEAKIAGERRDFLLRFNDRIRETHDPASVVLTAAELVGRECGAARVGYGEVSPDGLSVRVERDWTRDATVASLAGEARLLDGFGPAVIAELRAGRTLVVSDCFEDPRAGAAHARTWDSIGCRSLVVVPILRDEVLRSIFYLHEPQPRRWAAEEIALAEEVAQRSWEAIERARVESELRELNVTLERRVAERSRELETAEQALRQSQKMEAVGQLTGGIAHDFNNLLAGISGSLELVQSRIAQGRVADVERYMVAAQGAARRAAALTHRLLAFSRRQTLEPKLTDVNRLVADMEDLIRRTVGPHIAVETVAMGGLWSTLVDPNQLENALLNLCINARDAMPAGGRLIIETANRWLDDRAARERDLPPGQYVSMCVSDNGTGMEPSVVERAFDPFFTTKPIGLGTGLGLSMIYGFARQSGGQVRIYSEIGQGTMVCVYLPRHLDGEEALDPASEALAPAPAVEAGKSVLVIDDEPLVRMLVVDVVEDLDLVALEAGDGPSGLKILQSDARIDLLITDVGLPNGMNGRQVADAARALRPGLKVIFVTGYAENAVLNHGHLDPGMHVVTKPFSMEALARRIETVMAEDRSVAPSDGR